MREPKIQNCYYCKKKFYAEPNMNQIGDDSWICDECAEGLVKAGVIEDGYGLISAASDCGTSNKE